MRSVARAPEVQVVRTTVRPRSRLHVIRVHARSLSKEAAAGTFQSLMQPRADGAALGNVALLELGEGEYGRGIFTRDDVPAGTPLLSVPLSLCFRAQREEAVSVPGASWGALTTGVVKGWPRLQTFYETYPLPWELRLGIALLDAQEGNAGNEFWGEYISLLPAPGDLPCLVTLEERARAALGDTELAEEAAVEQARLATMCPELAHTTLEGAAAAAPTALQWGVACARSRAFEGAPGVYCLVPLIDMVNHGYQRLNARVELRVEDSRDLTQALLDGAGSFELVAVESIPRGTEVLVSYGCNDYSNARLLTQYGFVRPDNPYDVMRWDAVPALAPEGETEDDGDGDSEDHSPGVAKEAHQEASEQTAPQPPCVSLELLEEALKREAVAAGLRWMRLRSSDVQLKAVLASLPTSSAKVTVDEATRAAELLACTRLLAYAEQAMVACESAEQRSGADDGDAQYAVARQYREQRAALVGRSRQVLATYLEFLSC